MKTKPYHWLAQHYDRFFATFRRPIDAARESILGPLWPRVKTACDLACGTGATALNIARRGIMVNAVDVSPAMCRLVREKVRHSGLAVRVTQADMCMFRLPQPVDLVICEGDALNHVPRKDDLPRVARAVFRALGPGGSFYFDVNNRAGFERYWTTTVCLEQPGVVLVMRNRHETGSDAAGSDIDWFLRHGNSWRRHRERVEEVCWSAAEIRSTLKAAGFGRIRSWDAAPFFGAGSMITRGCRSIYMARKPR